MNFTANQDFQSQQISNQQDMNTQITYRVKVPVKRYILKYIQFQEGIDTNKIVFNNASFFARLLKALTCTKSIFLAEKSEPTLVYDENILLELTCNSKHGDIVFITNKNVREFNNLMHKMIVNHLSAVVLLSKDFGIQEKDSIAKFMNSIGIEEDDGFSFETAKKASYRSRVRTQKEIFK